MINWKEANMALVRIAKNLARPALIIGAAFAIVKLSGLTIFGYSTLAVALVSITVFAAQRTLQHVWDHYFLTKNISTTKHTHQQSTAPINSNINTNTTTDKTPLFSKTALALLTSNLTLVKHQQQPKASAGYNYFEGMPIEIINHIFQYLHLPSHPWLPTVNKKFNSCYVPAAQLQFIRSSSIPLIRDLDIKEGFDKLIAEQKEEIKYLTDNKEDISHSILGGMGPKYKKFNTLIDKLNANSLLNETSIAAYREREKYLNEINVCIVRHKIGLFSVSLLDLSYCHLTRLPDELFNDGALQKFWSEINTLNIRNNRLRALPDIITRCTELRWLYVQNNQLTGLPKSIKKCTKLNMLVAYNNQLTDLKSIGQWPAQARLIITQNYLSTLPDDLYLHQYIFMDKEHNQISKEQCLALQKKPLVENKEEKQEQKQVGL